MLNDPQLEGVNGAGINGQKRVVIVGGVAGGATAAARLRRMDESCRITVFEKGPHVSFANCGLPYFIGNVIKSRDSLLLADPKLFKERFNIDVRINHEVLSIDRAKKTVQVKDLASQTTFTEPYDNLVLSPGASPIVPPWPGVNLPGIFTVRSIPDSDAIKQYVTTTAAKRAALIGGGFIGIEMAENFSHLGLQVTIIERQDQLLAPFDPEMVQPLPPYLAAHGIEFMPGCTVSGFQKTASGIQVLIDGQDSLEADIIIVAIGVRPEAKLARDCGLEIGKLGGVRTDSSMRTSDPSIFAVGDSVETRNFITGEYGLIPLAGPANRQGRVAADAICGRPSQYRGIQGSAVCQAFDMVMACTGLSEKSLKRSGIAYEKVYLYPHHHVGYFPGAETVSMKLLFDPEGGKILGAQAVGMAGAEKRIDVISTAIQGGLTVQDLEEVELCYAPQVGAAKDPVNLAGMLAANALRKDAPVVHWSQGIVPSSTQSQAKEPHGEAAEAQGDTALFLDVRSVEEFARGHVEQAVNIPLPELRERQEEVPEGRKIFVYCAAGQRGYYATRLLRQLGRDAHNVSGGMTTLRASKI